MGFLYEQPVERIAQRYPKTLYVILDGALAKEPNIASVKFDAAEGSVLAGVVAAALSKAKVVSFIGGNDIPIINEFRDGFKRGVQWTDPQIEVLSSYVGSGPGAFSDPVRGREIALSAIAAKADVIFHAAAASGNGVIKAAKEKGVWAIGVDVDQSHIAPATVATSMVKNFDVAMRHVLQVVKEGHTIAGKNLVLGVEKGAVSLAPFSEGVARGVSERVKAATKDLLRIPDSPAHPN